ncbi:MAG TPA: serine hydrolase domain-containing protein [Gemmatimonadales bacterium]|nr:serine hydrolase domain-containing protein [Gemmatimonadales bacterium]
MRWTLALLAVGAVLPKGAAAQSASGPAALDSVERYVRAELERQRIPGMSVAILQGDSVLLARGYGFANLEHRVPATDSTIYQSGSVGKQFTSAAIVTLAREGRLGLDDPIRKYLPEAPSSWSGITVRHLLTHTSGIPDYTAKLVDFRRDYTEEALARLYARLPLDFKPGATWSYSNTGYALLGFIVRRVTGRFYGDYLKERVFEPLGMRTARVISESDIVPNRAAGYELVDGEIRNQGWVSPSLNTTADGALYLTVNDLARWAIALNHARIPDSAGLAMSWTPVRLNDGGTYPYGFGWRLDDQRGRPRIGHGGSWQGFRASIQRYPRLDLTVIALANLDAAMPEVITTTIAGILEPALLPPHLLPPSADGPPEPIDRLLADLAAGKAQGKLAAGLRTFASRSVREEWGRSIATVSRWENLGCDAVGDRGISRLGTAIERICYARGIGADSRLLVSVAYGKDWQAADMDSYEY